MGGKPVVGLAKIVYPTQSGSETVGVAVDDTGIVDFASTPGFLHGNPVMIALTLSRLCAWAEQEYYNSTQHEYTIE